jgi:hypothetical protein
MEIMERYLAAVRRDLPTDKADDIVAELRDDLLTRIEAREEALDRPLDKAEMETLLRDFGRPIVVAARYREHQYLIGPETFPFYLAGLRFGALIVGILTMVLLGVDLAFGSRNAWQVALHAASTFFNFAIFGFGIVTFLFALIERRGGVKEDTGWVEDMPSIDDLTKDSRMDAPLEIVGGALFLLWWFGFIPFPLASWDQFTLTGAPVWAGLFWPIGVLVGTRLVMSLLALVPSRLSSLRHALNVATAIGAVAIAIALFQAGHWIDVTPGSSGAADAAHIEQSLNLAMRVGLVASVIVWSLACLGGIWKWIRGSKPA